MRTQVRDPGCILWDIYEVCSKTKLFTCCGSSAEIVELNFLGFADMGFAEKRYFEEKN